MKTAILKGNDLKLQTILSLTYYTYKNESFLKALQWIFLSIAYASLRHLTGGVWQQPILWVSYNWLFVDDCVNELDLGEMLLSSFHLNFWRWALKLNYSDHKVFVPSFHLVCFPNCLLLRFFAQSCFYLSVIHFKFKSNNLGIKLNLIKKAFKCKSFANRNWLFEWGHWNTFSPSSQAAATRSILKLFSWAWNSPGMSVDWVKVHFYSISCFSNRSNLIEILISLRNVGRQNWQW